jgi:anti-sigma-K factor RskA
MNRDDFYNLIPAYALDALDPDERAAFEAQLASDPEAQRQLAEYQQIAEGLLLTVPARQAPAHLGADLRARVAATRPAAPPEQTGGPKVIALPRRLLALAAMLAIVFGVIWALELTGSQQEMPAEVMYSQLDEIADAPRFELVAMEAEPMVYGEMVASPDGRYAVIKVDCLPQLDPQQTFQLWVEMGDETLDGGTFEAMPPDQTTYLYVPLREPLVNYSGFTASIEPAGGSPLGNQRSGPRVFSVPL